MKKSNYISLHTHDTYSLQDALGSTELLVETACNCGMDSLAITNHGNVKCFPDLYAASKKYGIKPIYGCEFYFTDQNISEIEAKDKVDYSHVVLLAKNYEGYKNIIKLSSLANGYETKTRPCISWNEIEKYNSGIISLSACAGGLLNKFILDNDDYESAEKRLKRWLEIFGANRFYLELQKHDTCCPELISKLNPQLEKWAKDYDLPLVCTNDSHYSCPSGMKAHKSIVSRRFKQHVNHPKFKYIYDDTFYFKGEAEMLALFPDNEAAVFNTREISDQIESFDIVNEEYNFPKAIINGITIEEKDAAVELRTRCETKLKAIGKNTDEYINRLNHELSVIERFGFCNYILIVADEMNWCRHNDVAVGPARGSAANSLTNYLAGITALDPIEYKLDFARFLNSGRVRIDPKTGKEIFSSMIDIDCDVSQHDRIKFLQHLADKYGYVYHLGTNGRYTAKNALKEAGASLNIPFEIMDEFTKLIMETVPGTDDLVSLDWNMNQSMTSEYVKKHKLQEVVNIAKDLENGVKFEGIHASGIIISDHAIDDLCPTRKADKTFPITEFDMGDVEKICKELKFDFLGLRTVSVIHETEKLIKKQYPNDPLPDYGEFPDSTVFNPKYGLDEVFQLGSGLAKKWYKAIAPSNINELSDLIALLRPGTLASGWTEKYATGGYTHQINILNDLFKDTKGIIIYQEQLIELAKAIAGFSSEKADDLRKACGKKDLAAMALLIPEFEKGAIDAGYTKDEIAYLVQQIKDNALYSFNKGHSMSYALLSYKTLFLKYHYPNEYHCAALNSHNGDRKKLNPLISQTIKHKLKILPPDINNSELDFSMIYNPDPNILTGIKPINGVGEKSAEAILKYRPYTSIDDFKTRVPKRNCNKKVIEALIFSGAFDQFESDRNKVYEMFFDEDMEFETRELAFKEKKHLGMFFTENPYAASLMNHRIITPTRLLDIITPGPITITGYIENPEFKSAAKTQNRYVLFSLSDGVTSLSVIGFKDVVEKYSEIISESTEKNPVTITGILKFEGQDNEEMDNIEDYKLMIIGKGASLKEEKELDFVKLKIKVIASDFDDIISDLSGFFGDTETYIYAYDNETKTKFEKVLFLDINDELCKEIEERYEAIIRYDYD